MSTGSRSSPPEQEPPHSADVTAALGAHVPAPVPAPLRIGIASDSRGRAAKGRGCEPRGGGVHGPALHRPALARADEQVTPRVVVDLGGRRQLQLRASWPPPMPPDPLRQDCRSHCSRDPDWHVSHERPQKRGGSTRTSAGCGNAWVISLARPRLPRERRQDTLDASGR